MRIACCASFAHTLTHTRTVLRRRRRNKKEKQTTDSVCMWVCVYCSLLHGTWTWLFALVISPIRYEKRSFSFSLARARAYFWLHAIKVCIRWRLYRSTDIVSLSLSHSCFSFGSCTVYEMNEWSRAHVCVCSMVSHSFARSHAFLSANRYSALCHQRIRIRCETEKSIFVCVSALWKIVYQLSQLHGSQQTNRLANGVHKTNDSHSIKYISQNVFSLRI